MTRGTEEITSERTRQITDEGYNSEHDKSHGSGTLAEAASAYISEFLYPGNYGFDERVVDNLAPDDWPFHHSEFKPAAVGLRNLVKAGALIAAAIDAELGDKTWEQYIADNSQEAYIRLVNTGGYTFEGTLSNVLASHLSTGWLLEAVQYPRNERA